MREGRGGGAGEADLGWVGLAVMKRESTGLYGRWLGVPLGLATGILR